MLAPTLEGPKSQLWYGTRWPPACHWCYMKTRLFLAWWAGKFVMMKILEEAQPPPPQTLSPLTLMRDNRKKHTESQPQSASHFLEFRDPDTGPLSGLLGSLKEKEWGREGYTHLQVTWLFHSGSASAWVMVLSLPFRITCLVISRTFLFIQFKWKMLVNVHTDLCAVTEAGHKARLWDAGRGNLRW